MACDTLGYHVGPNIAGRHVVVLVRGESALAKDSDSWRHLVVGDRVQTVSCKFVDLWATVDLLLFEWAILQMIRK